MKFNSFERSWKAKAISEGSLRSKVGWTDKFVVRGCCEVHFVLERSIAKFAAHG